MKSGTVQVTLKDGGKDVYENVANLSFGGDWVFMKFANGSRTQIPAKDIQKISEDCDVYVRGIRTENETVKD